jgi:ADP-ribose pyrophosphatase YjhB (NUDIX family)
VPQRIRLAAYAFTINNDGALLLVRISDRGDAAGEWTLPGGGLDWGEHPEKGMGRELYEETGLTGTVVRVLGIDSLVFPTDRPPGADSIHSVRIVYEVACEGEPEVIEKDGTVDAACWIPVGDLQGYPLVDLVNYALSEAGLHPHSPE